MSKDLSQAQLELKKIRAQLTRQLKELDLAQAKDSEVRRDLTLADGKQQELNREKHAIEDLIDRSSKDVQNLAMTKEELLQKTKKLREEMQAVARMPTPTKQLRYHTPVSRPVRSEEFHFECLHGRVSFIDLKSFISEIEDNEKDTIKRLETSWKAEGLTSQIGAFRLRYVFARERETVDQFVPRSAPGQKAHFRAGLVAWKVEPQVKNRGETLETALNPQSAFGQVMSRVVPQQSVVTLWVYPDSFAMFRRLRDVLHDQGIEVAAWPIPFGADIAASPDGHSSRGQ